MNTYITSQVRLLISSLINSSIFDLPVTFSPTQNSCHPSTTTIGSILNRHWWRMHLWWFVQFQRWLLTGNVSRFYRFNFDCRFVVPCNAVTRRPSGGSLKNIQHTNLAGYYYWLNISCYLSYFKHNFPKKI